MLAFHNRNLYIQLLLLILCAGLGVSAAFYPTIVMMSIIVVILATITIVSPITTLAVMLILAPLRTLIATEATVQLPLDIGQLSFVGFALLWWFHRTIRRQHHLQLPMSPIIVAVAAFTIVAGISAFTAFSIQFWLTEWLKWITILVVMVIVLDLGRARRWELFVAILIAAGFANAIVGLYIFFGGSGADHLLINDRYFRAFGTFGQPNPYGGFLGLLLPITIMASYAYLIQLWDKWQISRRVSTKIVLKLGYCGAATGIMLAGLVASWSRGAWLGFIVSVAAMAFCLPRKLWQSVALSATALAIVGGMWFGGIIPNSIQERVLSSTEELFSFSDVRGVDITTANYAIVERLAHWQAAINMATDNFWLGIGFGNYEVVYEQYRLINWEFPLGHAHNYYLNIFAETGIIGSLFYISMWLCIVWITWKVRSHPDILARSVGVGLMGSWAYFSFHSLLDNLYVNNMFLHLGVMLGLLTMFYSQLTKSIQWSHYVSGNKHQ